MSRFSRPVWSWTALAAASAAILLSAPAQYFGRQEDDLLYFLASHALLRGGYRMPTVPGSPPFTMINPGFPALLLPVTWLAGENFAFHQIFCALLLAASPWVLWLWLRRRQDPLDAALICLLFASSPLVLSQAGTVMSEGAYLLIALGLLLDLERRGRGVASGIALMAVTQVRTAGISLIPAALARPIGEKKWAQAAWTLAPCAAGMLLWNLWCRRVSGGDQKLQEMGVLYGAHSPLHALAVVADNARYYLSSWGSCYLPLRWAAGPAALAVGIVLASASLAGIVRLLRRDPWEPAVWMLGGTAALHAVWPWHYERYLILPLPLLLWTAAAGLGKSARAGLVVLLACQVAFQSRRWLIGENAWSRPELPQTYAWLKSRTAPSDALASALYLRDGFYAARPSLPIPDSPDAAAFAAYLKKRRARYVLWAGRPDLGLSLDRTAAIRLKLDRAGEELKDPSWFKLVYENSHENSRIYRLK